MRHALGAQLGRGERQLPRGSGDKPETWHVCERREALRANLEKIGCCYGREGEAGYQNASHACGPGSYRQ
jgi:hypothetical protein